MVGVTRACHRRARFNDKWDEWIELDRPSCLMRRLAREEVKYHSLTFEFGVA
jgi:hypothetical protein